MSLVGGDATAPEDSVLSVDVDDVDAAYALAQRLGYEIVHPLTDEAWGVRRFFIRDPHGNVINIVGQPHRPPGGFHVRPDTGLPHREALRPLPRSGGRSALDHQGYGLLRGHPVHRSERRTGRAYELERDGAVLALGLTGSRFGETASITLVFDEDVACARIPAAGGAVLDGPTDQAWGLRQAVVADPEGQRWELSQHLRDVEAADWGAEQLAPLPG